MIAYLDLGGGLSGDIFLSACLDAGVSMGFTSDDLTAILKKIDLGPWSFEEEIVPIFGLTARRIRFKVDLSPPHRSWAHIRDRIIGPANLPERVKQLSLAAFEALALAEAKVHGTTMDEVHFHEVGADDSILDLVGAAACLELMDIDRLIASPVPLARGMGHCQHGPMPLPAPATVQLLMGAEVVGTNATEELITPTGAAILTWVNDFGPLPAMKLTYVGYGVGSRLPKDGLTRLFAGRDSSGSVTTGCGHSQVEILTTTLDDSSPELIGPLMDDLLKLGALDVTFSPVQMKKNRPGIRLEVLCPLELAKTIANYILEHSSTLGVRSKLEERICLERCMGRVKINDLTGDDLAIDGKWIKKPSGRWDFRPEFESVRLAAQTSGQPMDMIYLRAQAASLSLDGPEDKSA